MKIAHVIVGLDVGGAEHMLSRVVTSFHSSNNEQLVVSLTDIGTLGRRLRNSGIEVHAMGMRSVFHVPIVAWKLMRVLRRSRPDIVQTWLYHSDLIGGIAARLCGFHNVVWGIRNTQIPQGRYSLTSALIAICARLSHWLPSKIVCCAEAARATHIKLGYRADRITVIANGYDLSVFRPTPELKIRVRRQLGFSEDLMVIGIVGRFDMLKDYANFVQAAAYISNLRPQVRFMMVGRGVDGSNSQLMGWINRDSLSDRFILLGERVDVTTLMAAMDIYCLASTAEGFPNVVAEAMAMQVPCVVTNVGDAALIVQDTGQVVPPRDSLALAKALIDMVDLPRDQRERLGVRARKVVESNYAIDAVAKQYVNLYSSLIQSHRANST